MDDYSKKQGKSKAFIVTVLLILGLGILVGAYSLGQKMGTNSQAAVNSINSQAVVPVQGCDNGKDKDGKLLPQSPQNYCSPGTDGKQWICSPSDPANNHPKPYWAHDDRNQCATDGVVKYRCIADSSYQLFKDSYPNSKLLSCKYGFTNAIFPKPGADGNTPNIYTVQGYIFVSKKDLSVYNTFKQQLEGNAARVLHLGFFNATENGINVIDKLSINGGSFVFFMNETPSYSKYSYSVQLKVSDKTDIGVILCKIYSESTHELDLELGKTFVKNCKPNMLTNQNFYLGYK